MCAGASAATRRWWARSRCSPSSSGSAAGTRASAAAPPASSATTSSASSEEQPGCVPQIVILRHQGNAVLPAATPAAARPRIRAPRDWYRDFARGVGDSRVVIGFEPDSLGTIECLPGSRRDAASRLASCATASTCCPSCRTPRSTSRRGASDWESAKRTAGPAALHRHPQGARLHAQRDPLRLDRATTSATASTSRAASAASRSSSPRPSTGAGRCTTSAGSTARKQHLADRQRVVSPAQARASASRHHRHAPPEGRRLPLDRPARLLGRLVQRRPAAGGLVVARAGADVRQNATTWLRPPRGCRFGWPRGPCLRAYAGDQIKR